MLIDKKMSYTTPLNLSYYTYGHSTSVPIPSSYPSTSAPSHPFSSYYISFISLCNHPLIPGPHLALNSPSITAQYINPSVSYINIYLIKSVTDPLCRYKLYLLIALHSYLYNWDWGNCETLK